ncbi:DJ-1/PfpI/YhbO family deglycase/protease [Leptolyngbya sp. FACHB-261]|uniref:DJ-1/PfpI/YhbO family deglycase/protease n=1 Tax=Leptolyngbya sp. FACHB-261 TaxID=2692806 RepID=UPI00168346D4|nr:DJ-1/PfpI/YhbO family deglycase/protease [Leptolyngbya sp. FACHB-261]MBD2102113.1 DJ-1/PfpI/YhbO family deglycase/protease [Leptolyngbya sp. FACHB-261]
MSVTLNSTHKPRVAILIEEKVEDAEFRVPHTALTKAGAEVVVLGPRMNEEYQGKQGKVSVKADGTTTEARAKDFDAVIIPGGMAPDRMRTNLKTVRFVQDAVAQNKLVAAICHGPQVLIEGDLLQGRRITGFYSIRKDIQNAGAEFIDESLVIDGNLLTSRRPGDLPVFTTAILNRLGLTVPDTTLPEENDRDAGWWKLGEEWGGSTKSEIVSAINTGLAGERYGLEAFEHYEQRATDSELRAACREICAQKQQHIRRLEARLGVLGESISLQAAASGAYATLKNWVQSSGDDISLLRRALGDLQTGVVDTYNLRNQLTDPATTEIFADMEVDIARSEQRIADIYHALVGSGGTAKPPQPTTGAAVNA